MSQEAAMQELTWDIFISYAREDEADVARPLGEVLRRAGARVWLDHHRLTVGDSLTEKIDEGLARSRYGAVVLSRHFFAKSWPRRELAGLRAREESDGKVILPIWHGVDRDTLVEFSPILADVLGVSTAEGIEHVAEALISVIFAPTSDGDSRSTPLVARRLIELIESHPDRAALREFLRLQQSQYYRYLGWGAGSVFEEYDFDGIAFDAFAPYVGHGARLTLVRFTEAWANPFEKSEDDGPIVSSALTDEVASLRDLRSRFERDPLWRERVLRDLASRKGSTGLLSDPSEFESWLRYGEPEVRFVLYAGRRSHIDAGPSSQQCWTELRRSSGSHVNVWTYDRLIDSFRDAEPRGI